MKKLKTGDVKRIEWMLINKDDKWAVVNKSGKSGSGRKTRDHARYGARKYEGARIARILSIGPKYVTVRISK